MPHIHEKIDFSVNALIIFENKVLLIHHKKLNTWLFVGGHVELNEDTDEALLREVKEECGLEVEVLSEKPSIQAEGIKFLYTPNFMDIHEISPTHKHIGMLYLARAKSDKFALSAREHNDIRWFTAEDLEKPEFNLMPSIKFYAQQALNKIKL